MDAQVDLERFRKLLARLCDVMGKPFTDELVDSWWGALRHVPFDVVKGKIEQHIATVGRDEKFPRPSQMRPQEWIPPEDGEVDGNPVRDFWRSSIVHEVAAQLGHTSGTFEGHVIGNRKTIGQALLLLLDDMTTQDMQFGRSRQLQDTCRRRCEEIARTFRHIATKGAPVLRHAVIP